jgi:hypothetical protein
MIYFGKQRRIKDRIKSKYSFVIQRRYRKVLSKKEPILHIYVTLRWGDYAYYMGINRVKRIVKDSLYELDGVLYHYPEEI